MDIKLAILGLLLIVAVGVGAYFDPGSENIRNDVSEEYFGEVLEAEENNPLTGAFWRRRSRRSYYRPTYRQPTRPVQAAAPKPAPVVQQPQYSCTDTDGNDNNKKGAITIKYPNGRTSSPIYDMCYTPGKGYGNTGTQLIERTCERPTGGYKFVNCNCVDGACQAAPQEDPNDPIVEYVGECKFMGSAGVFASVKYKDASGQLKDIPRVTPSPIMRDCVGNKLMAVTCAKMSDSFKDKTSLMKSPDGIRKLNEFRNGLYKIIPYDCSQGQICNHKTKQCEAESTETEYLMRCSEKDDGVEIEGGFRDNIGQHWYEAQKLGNSCDPDGSVRKATCREREKSINGPNDKKEDKDWIYNMAKFLAKWSVEDCQANMMCDNGKCVNAPQQSASNDANRANLANLMGMNPNQQQMMQEQAQNMEEQRNSMEGAVPPEVQMQAQAQQGNNTPPVTLAIKNVNNKGFSISAGIARFLDLLFS